MYLQIYIEGIGRKN